MRDRSQGYKKKLTEDHKVEIRKLEQQYKESLMKYTTIWDVWRGRIRG